MNIPNSPAAEQTVSAWTNYLRSSITGADVTGEFWESYGRNLDKIMAQTHKLDRGIRDLGNELDVRVNELEDFFTGKTVLDIGCGTGKLVADVARLKRTHVVALDHNPEVLDRVPERKNVEKIHGSAYQLPEAIVGREFDVVISSFSSLLWARTAEQHSTALKVAFDATAEDGTTLFIPFISNPTYRRNAASEVIAKTQRLGSLSFQEKVEAHETMKVLYVHGLLDLASVDLVGEWVNGGEATVAFRPSRENKLGKPIQERYSVVISKLTA